MGQKSQETQNDALNANADDLAEFSAFLQSCDDEARAENSLTQ
jgi:hypothetical protein